jgi:NADPH:quinone reductase-like Zn-dependent oxidoreductase
MAQAYPTQTRSLCLAKVEDGLSYDAVIKILPVPSLKHGQVLVRMGAVAFNHKEVCDFF